MLRFLRVIQKWWWLVLLLCALTVGAAWVASWLAGPQYEATIMVQISAPPSSEAALYSQSSRQALYDTIEQNRASFNEFLLASDIAEQVLESLPNISMTASELQQRLTTELPAASQFMAIRVRAVEPETAVLLAGAVAEVGRQRYGQLLANPIANTRQFTERELAAAGAELAAAERELTQFQIDNKIELLQPALDAEYEAIRSLRLTRDLAQAEGDTAKAEATDRIILEREARFQDMISLAATYNELANRVEHARDNYSFLTAQQAELRIREEQVREAGFIQVITPTALSPKPVPLIDGTLMRWGVAGSVLVGVALAFLLEHLQRSGAWRGFQPQLIGNPIKAQMMKWRLQLKKLPDFSTPVAPRLFDFSIRLPALSPRRRWLTLLLLLFFLIPAVLYNIARNRAIQEVVEVGKINAVAQTFKETPRPLKTATSLPATIGSSVVAAATATPTPVTGSTAIATITLLPTFNLEAYQLATPISTPPPTPAPFLGLVSMPDSQRLNIRAGPALVYEIVGQLESGDQFVILQRTSDGNWLEIETSTHQKGWVASRYVEILGDVKAISIATNLPPTPAAGRLLSLDIEGGTASGQLAPGQEQWYTFFEEDEETVLVLIFTPKVGVNQVQFFLLDQKQIPVWPPKDPETLAHIGASSYPASDRDGDNRTGELVWRGGPLTPGVRYYLRLVNRSDAIIHYCLATRDVFQWSCR